MFDKIEVIQVICDVCGNPEGMNDDYMPMHQEESDALDSIRNASWPWLIGDGKEGELGKHYCPDCHSYDDNDVLTIKTADAGSVDK